MTAWFYARLNGVAAPVSSPELFSMTATAIVTLAARRRLINIFIFNRPRKATRSNSSALITHHPLHASLNPFKYARLFSLIIIDFRRFSQPNLVSLFGRSVE